MYIFSYLRLQGKHCSIIMNFNPVKVYRHLRVYTIASIRCLSGQVVVASIYEVHENRISCCSDVIVFGLLLFSPRLLKFTAKSCALSNTFMEQVIREKLEQLEPKIG